MRYPGRPAARLHAARLRAGLPRLRHTDSRLRHTGLGVSAACRPSAAS